MIELMNDMHGIKTYKARRITEGHTNPSCTKQCIVKSNTYNHTSTCIRKKKRFLQIIIGQKLKRWKGEQYKMWNSNQRGHVERFKDGIQTVRLLQERVVDNYWIGNEIRYCY